MNVYTIALYLHRIGALGLLIAIGLEWLHLWQMRRAATLGQARKTFQSTQRARGIAMPFMLALLVSGIYMTATVWGPIPWILVALSTLVLLSVVTVRLSGPGLAAEGGPAVPPAVWVAMQLRAAVTLGIVFLMVMKPGLVESLVAIGAAVLVGLALSIPAMVERRRVPGG